MIPGASTNGALLLLPRSSPLTLWLISIVFARTRRLTPLDLLLIIVDLCCVHT
jgi:hypothetical protein